MVKTILGASLLIAGVAAFAPHPTPLPPRTPAETPAYTSGPDTAVYAEIQRMLEAGAAAWTQGNLDRFMEDYAPDTTTTYVGSKGILRGREAIQRAYAPRFAPGAKQDSLSFEQLEVDVLAKDVVHVLAYYRLTRNGSVVARGPTSLVMRKIKGRWLIVHDHSS